MLLIAFFLGSLIGLTLALTGAGGGILAVPALTLGLGWTMTQASPVALLTVACAATIGMTAGLIKGEARFRAALMISATGILAAPFGQRLAHILPERWLSALFACVMLLVAQRLFQASRHPPGEDSPTLARTRHCIIDPETGRLIWNIRAFFKLCLIGITSGLTTGLLGVGGGFILVPALLNCSNIPMNGIISTSLMIISLISTGAVIAAFSTGQLNFTGQAVFFIAGATGGMLAGRQFAQKIPATLLKQGFSVLIAGVAVMLIYRSLH